MIGNLNMGGKRIYNLCNPTDGGNAVNRNYLQQNNYTKSQINNALSDYYNKTEVNNSLNDKANKTTFGDYYDKSEVDALLNHLISFSNQ